ncbi:hypothetical protein COO60DRAFT_1537784 [Scenedesmus sp. NREL 46B-D3]|nr:hypothetical protein COO60DRAFT_1537784 [Scenedesmus sp. NREL 46B-D3]
MILRSPWHQTRLLAFLAQASSVDTPWHLTRALVQVAVVACSSTPAPCCRLCAALGISAAGGSCRDLRCGGGTGWHATLPACGGDWHQLAAAMLAHSVIATYGCSAPDAIVDGVLALLVAARELWLAAGLV